ncbi:MULTISPECIES: hypothetical protein [Leptolyngbya]|uniref:hypothetical protein n=1 Tax=Leptolyngbya TaxID=47251 RepID=UPI00037DB8C7|nr:MULTISPECIES: hypothetical protein [Leptolyngbya]MBD2368566.1 hypothetical protein [Leptolyngbya sp. FACHB-161]MBD2375173.1 hypothetical protein [Leptolyngbya sp. FACHB-238]MBD2399592.1 hypothetical protein [Leptolyngbya sp. FACHB-239]MBD2405797.1 hypothetical protein [Leptolyngbya sp. FACHB-402]ULP28614.1 hypothetical protein MCP04_21725 [Leptolyngbya boryana IU 594]
MILLCNEFKANFGTFPTIGNSAVPCIYQMDGADDEQGDRNSVNSADLTKAPATFEFSESLN